MPKGSPPVLEKKKEASSLPPGVGGEVTPLKIAYVGGGSRGWAHALMRDLALCPAFSGEVRLYDIDRQAARFNARYGNWIQAHPQAVSRWKYRAVGTLRECLKGADFVFASILPGPIECMKVDLELPERYGIFQAVGDTVGPGGQMRSLRAIRDYRVIARAVGEHAPHAWVLNFTNPMTVCTRTLYEEFPRIRAYGCCHEVFGTQRLLGQLWAQKTGRPAPRRDEVDINILGVNHFTWVDRARCGGMDLLGLVREHVAQPGVIRRFTTRQIAPKKQYFAGRKQVAFELFRRFGVLAAAGDRHLAEFVPWFLTSRDSCHRWGFVLTPYSYRLNRWRAVPVHHRRQLASGRHPDLGRSGEEYINQMLALVGRTEFRTNVNLPNRGQMLRTPPGAVVETNALFSHGSVQPLASGGLPDNVNTWVQRHVHNQETLVKAVFSRDKDLAFQAFLNDPLVSIPADRAWELFNRMLRGTRFSF